MNYILYIIDIFNGRFDSLIQRIQRIEKIYKKKKKKKKEHSDAVYIFIFHFFSV